MKKNLLLFFFLILGVTACNKPTNEVKKEDNEETKKLICVDKVKENDYENSFEHTFNFDASLDKLIDSTLVITYKYNEKIRDVDIKENNESCEDASKLNGIECKYNTSDDKKISKFTYRINYEKIDEDAKMFLEVEGFDGYQNNNYATLKKDMERYNYSCK